MRFNQSNSSKGLELSNVLRTFFGKKEVLRILLEREEQIYSGSFILPKNKIPRYRQFSDEYKDGKYHGRGTYTWSNGDKYIGEWKDNKKHGKGTYIWGKGHNIGHKYVGEWKDDKMNGQGIYTKPTGERYVGEYKDDKRDGKGTSTYSDGSKYEGEYKDNKKHGKGTYTYGEGPKQGYKHVGEWRKDRIVK
ncbi:hypothetical protein HOG00_00020 [bacterium]|nr:hypothetical protein [bacterium]